LIPYIYPPIFTFKKEAATPFPLSCVLFQRCL